MKKLKTTLRNISPGLFKVQKCKSPSLRDLKVQKIFKKQGFTLVELIIVIAIIAVLAVAAFMMLTKWLGKSRDSRRLGDLGTIKKALEISYSDSDNGLNIYPDPTNTVEILDGSGVVMWTQGVFGLDTIGEMDNMQKAPQDPSDQSYYKYAVTLDKKEFQLGTVLEDGSDVSVIGSVFAANGEARLDGNYDGYVSYPTTGGTMIFKTPSLLVKGEPTINVFSGSTDKFMLNGEGEGVQIELRSIKTDENTSAEDIATALGIDEKSAAVVLKNETGSVVSIVKNDLEVETKTYSWQSGEWSPVITTDDCGIVEQTRTVECVGNDENVYDDSNCSGTKPSTTQSVDTGLECSLGYSNLQLAIHGYLSSNSSTITELKFIGESGTEYSSATYIVSSSVTGDRWNSTNCWSKDNLFDEDTNYIGNYPTGCNSSTIFAVYLSDVTDTINFSFPEPIVEVQIWMGSPELRIPKNLYIYNSDNNDLLWSVTPDLSWNSVRKVTAIFNDSEVVECQSESDSCNSTDETSCKTIYDSDNTLNSGIYWIDPDGSGSISPFKVYCDMDNDSGGWTLVAFGKAGETNNDLNRKTTSEYLPDSVKDMNTTSKFSDTIINSIRGNGNGDYRVEVPVVSAKRFYKSHTYNHLSVPYATGYNPLTITSYASLSWDDAVTRSTDYSTHRQGLSDSGFNAGGSVNTMDGRDGTAWQVRSASDGRYTTNCTSHTAPCDLFIWVR